MVDWSQPARGDSGDPPVLDPHVWESLSSTGSPGGGGDKPEQSLMPKPSFHNPRNGLGGALIEWRLTWWPELAAVPQQEDVPAFTKRIWASSHMPKECYCTTNGENNYMTPPTPHCMGCDNYLLPPDTRVWHPRLLAVATQEDPSLCKGPATLG